MNLFILRTRKVKITEVSIFYGNRYKYIVHINISYDIIKRP